MATVPCFSEFNGVLYDTLGKILLLFLLFVCVYYLFQILSNPLFCVATDWHGSVVRIGRHLVLSMIASILPAVFKLCSKIMIINQILIRHVLVSSIVTVMFKRLLNME